MNRKIFPLIVIFALIVMPGCSLISLPGTSVVPPPATAIPLGTQVAEVVAQTQAAQTAVANAAANTLQALFTNTPESTFTLTLSPAPSLTNTPNLTSLTVSKDTNCRSGPSSVYDILGYMRIGQVADVLGRSSAGDYWIIRLPSNPSIICTIWGGYATLNGDVSGLQVMTPAPTPTLVASATPGASFTVSYYAIEVCGASDWGIKFQIVNNGTVTWESNRVVAKDLVSSESNSEDRDFFPNYNESGCALTSSDLNLEPGEIGFTSTNDFFVANPSGHNFTATIRVCSLDGLTGTCLEKTITFTP